MSGKFYLWSQNAATNGNVDTTCPWPEGMAPSQVNDSARAMMAAIASYRDDMAGVGPSNAVLTVGGTTSAYVLSSNTAWDQIRNGMTITFKVGSNLTNTGACTLNVDSVATRQIRAISGENLTGGELVEGSVYTVTYHQPANEFLLHNFHGSRGDNVGDVKFTARTTAPSGWLLCGGQAVSRMTYAALFTAIGTTYGVGNGETTFNVPDIRGRVIAGKDNMDSDANRLTIAGSGINGNSLGAAGGDEVHDLQITEIPGHTHGPGTLRTETAGAHEHEIPAYHINTAGTSSSTARLSAGNATAPSPFNFDNMTIEGAHQHDVTSGATTSTGGGNAHNNVQPTIILNAIIRH